MILRKNDHKKVTAVAEVHSKQSLEQTDINVLLQRLQPERHDAIKDFLADAPSFNVVFFSKVYDCRHLENFTLSALVKSVRGLREPQVLLGPGILTSSTESRNALDFYCNYPNAHFGGNPASEIRRLTSLTLLENKGIWK